MTPVETPEADSTTFISRVHWTRSVTHPSYNKYARSHSRVLPLGEFDGKIPYPLFVIQPFSHNVVMVTNTATS